LFGIVPEIRFTEEEIADDVWEVPPGCLALEKPKVDIVYPPEVLDQETQDYYIRHLETAVNAHKVLVGFQDFLLTTIHPDPPSDAKKDVRDANTFFEQTATNIHPAALDPRDLDLNDHNGSLINATMRHAHNAYCQTRRKKQNDQRDGENSANNQENPSTHQRQCTGCRKSAYEVSLEGTKVGCRFDYPKDLCEKTHMAVKQYRVKLKDGNEEIRCQLEMKPKRNDGWLNSHMDPLLTLWRANFDLQLTIDVGKITNYMTKYMTKSEAKQSKGAQAMIRRIMRQALDEGKSTEYVLRRTMAKLHGEPILSKQAVCHLIMSQPVVVCSHSFSKVNLENNSRRFLEPNETEGNDDSDTSPATKMTMMDAYARRMDATNWESEDAFHTAVDLD
jgi:hypothetical protein